MWEALVMHPRGRIPARKFIVLLATIFVVGLSYIITAVPVAAAPEATWEGDSIMYDGGTYTGPSSTAEKKGLSDIPTDARLYEYRKNNKSHIIYFEGIDVPKSAKEATYIVYSVDPPDTYRDPRQKQTISLAPATDAPLDGVSEGTSGQCNVDGIGYLICPLGYHIANAVDTTYDIIASFLVVQPILDGNNSLYRLWDVFRNIANLLFVIGFIVVIYSFVSGGVGGDAYNLRRILPRIVVAAILVNLSYWICAIAVDISNILGASIQSLFEIIRDTAIGTEKNINFDWSDISNYIYSGGAVAVGTLGFLTAAGGSVLSLSFILIGILIPIAFAAFVALIVLAARQALIVILVIISPLAFTAYILPNTEKYFERWRSVFVTMLLVFPIFSVLFGGSQLAALAIMQNASSIAVLLLGLAVQVVPLVITPLLIQFSGSLIGRIAGMVNNSSKGLVDRSRNWANDRAEYHKQRNLARPNKGWNNANLARRGARRMYAKKVGREKRLEAYKKEAENSAHDRQFWQGPISSRVLPQSARNYLNRSSYGYADQRYREADQEHRRIEGDHDRHWNERMRMLDDDGNVNPHFDKRILERELAIKTLAEQSKSAESSVQSSYDLMKTGVNPYSMSKTPISAASNEFDAVVSAAAAAARSSRIEGEVQRSAGIVESREFARSLKENESLRIRAAGPDAESGANRVLASAKAAVTKDLMQAKEDFQNTIDYTVASDNNRLFELFKETETLHERVAYAHLLVKNGPGSALLDQALLDLTSEGKYANPEDPDLIDLKEVLATDAKFRSASRALEVWGNNEPDPATGEMFTNFAAAKNSLKTWNDISPSRFAEMSKPNQLFALRLLQRKETPENFAMYVDRINRSVASENIKGTPARALQRLSTDPSADLSDLVALADEEED